MDGDKKLSSMAVYDGHDTYRNVVDFPEVCADKCGELKELLERTKRTTDETSLKYLNDTIIKLSELACENCVGPTNLRVGPWTGKSCPISGLVERTI